MFCAPQNSPVWPCVSYPPGIIQDFAVPSRDIQETILTSDDKSPEIVLSLVPEQWSSPEDSAILAELARESMPYLFYDEANDPLKDELFAMSYFPSALDMRPLADKDIEEALLQFEEDSEYEESLEVEQIKNAEVNLHRLLACSELMQRPGWLGGPGEMNPAAHGLMGSLTFHKERYRFKVAMITSFPHNKQGYALGWTDYGKIYFPERFREYVPQVGQSCDVSVALQDVAPKNRGKAASFRFTAIYMH